MVVEILVMGCNAVNGYAHQCSEKVKDLKRNWRIQWGRWDCQSKEMIVEIICHVEVLMLNQEVIVTRLFGRRLSL